LADKTGDSFLRVGPAYVSRDAINLLTQLPVTSLKQAMTADIGEPLDKPGLRSWRRRSRLVLKDLMGADRVLYLKRFLRPPVEAQVARMLLGAWRHSTAWLEWNNILRLQAAGVPTMRPIAFAEKMAGFWELGSLLCTEQVPGESLEKWLPAGWPAAARTFGPAWRKRAVAELAQLVRRIHQANLCHRDLYTSHIFVRVEPDGRTCFYLIDLQRMFRLGLRKRRWRVKDLAALAASAPEGLISRTDRVRFLLAYLGGRAAQQSEWKTWWRNVEAKGRRMMRHHLARMARLAGVTGR
jgi:hypothetical protein